MLDLLPDEVAEAILCGLDVASVLNCRAVCQRLSALCSDACLWRARLRRVSRHSHSCPRNISPMPLGMALARMENDLVKAEQAKYDSLVARLVGLTKNSVSPAGTVKIRLRLVDDDKDPYEQGGRVQVPLQAGDHIVAGNRGHGPVRHAVVWTSPRTELSQSGRGVGACHVIYCDNGALSITPMHAWMRLIGVGATEVFHVWYCPTCLPVSISRGLAGALFDAEVIISDGLDDFGFAFFIRTRKALHIQQRDEAEQCIERAVRSGATAMEESGDIVVAE